MEGRDYMSSVTTGNVGELAKIFSEFIAKCDDRFLSAERSIHTLVKTNLELCNTIENLTKRVDELEGKVK